jgi:hypothetical protein
MIVQRVGLIHGSLLFLKMAKDKVSLDQQRLQITIEALKWELYSSGSLVTTSAMVTGEIAESILMKVMTGNHFENFLVINEEETDNAALQRECGNKASVQ